MRVFTSFILLLVLCSWGLPASAQLGCGSSVSVNGGAIEVAAVSGDDAPNIECALNAATAQGFGSVLLTSPQYSIASKVVVDGFTGEFKGISIANTRVQVQDGWMNCNASNPNVIQFSNGFGVVVRFMTIAVGSPCQFTGSPSVIGFTTDPNNCADRTTFGTVDRVTIRGQGLQGTDFVDGVLMFTADNCGPRILGTLKVNRSTFDQLDRGVVSGVVANGQVDVNFNTFTAVGIPIFMRDQSQSTTILGNMIEYNNGDYGDNFFGRYGIRMESLAGSPANNSTTIKNNTFRNQLVNSFGIAVGLGVFTDPVNHAVFISDNIFEGATASQTADNGAGIGIEGINDGVISGNAFRGGTREWIFLTTSTARPAIAGWSILANDFSQSTAEIDIQLIGASESVVGRGQDNPSFFDQTGANDILEGTAQAAP